MDHDVSAGVDVQPAGAGSVGRVGVGDAQGEVGRAVRVAAGDGVAAFGGFVVAALLFGFAGAPAEPDTLSLQLFAAGVERHGVRGFDHEDAVGVDGRGLRVEADGGRRGEDGEETQHVPEHGMGPWRWNGTMRAFVLGIDGGAGERFSLTLPISRLIVTSSVSTKQSDRQILISTAANEVFR